MMDKSGRRLCVDKCPAGFEADERNAHICRQCDGVCHKGFQPICVAFQWLYDVIEVCPGFVVDSVATSQMYRGCTHIHGVLEIMIRGGSERFFD